MHRSPLVNWTAGKLFCVLDLVMAVSAVVLGIKVRQSRVVLQPPVTFCCTSSLLENIEFDTVRTEHKTCLLVLSALCQFSNCTSCSGSYLTAHAHFLRPCELSLETLSVCMPYQDTSVTSIVPLIHVAENTASCLYL
jgi:hypothetical protein